MEIRKTLLKIVPWNRAGAASPDEDPAPRAPERRNRLAEALVAAVRENARLDARARRRRFILRSALLLSAIALVVVIGSGTDNKFPIVRSVYAAQAIPNISSGVVGHVAFIPLEGAIDGDLFGPPVFPNTVRYVAEALALAQEASSASGKALAAVIFYVNSPGGGAGASAQAYRIVREFRNAHPDVPIIMYVSRGAYSGGYYIALGGNRIVADEEAGVGSIGVIMRWKNFSGIARMLGIYEDRIVSGPRKAKGSELEALDPADRAEFQRSIDQTFSRFLGAVEESRKIPMPDLIHEISKNDGISSGATFSANDALAKKLIDGIVPVERLIPSVVEELAATGRFTQLEIIRYDRELSALERVKQGAKSTLAGALGSIMDPEGTERPILYLK